jgi:hypothetical protein
MIDYKKIYTFFDPISNRAFRGSIFDFSKADPSISRGEKPLDNVVEVFYSMGEINPKDIIWTTNAHPLILSEVVIEIFTKNNFSGWDTYPVQVFDKNRKELKKKYFGLVINGRADYVDFRRSELISKKIGFNYAPHVKGRYFNNDKWDGTDFFMEYPDLDNKINMFRYCTDRVYKSLKKNKITNLNFENLTETDILYDSLAIGAGQKLQSQLGELMN